MNPRCRMSKLIMWMPSGASSPKLAACGNQSCTICTKQRMEIGLSLGPSGPKLAAHGKWLRTKVPSQPVGLG